MSYSIAYLGACVNPMPYVWVQNVEEHFCHLEVIL